MPSFIDYLFAQLDTSHVLFACRWTRSYHYGNGISPRRRARRSGAKKPRNQAKERAKLSSRMGGLPALPRQRLRTHRVLARRVGLRASRRSPTTSRDVSALRGPLLMIRVTIFTLSSDAVCIYVSTRLSDRSSSCNIW